MLETTCCICGERITQAASRPDANAICPGCAPNLQASIDRRLEAEAMYVTEDLLRDYLEEQRQLVAGRSRST